MAINDKLTESFLQALKEIEVIENMEFKDRKKWKNELIRLEEVLKIQ